MEDGDPELLRWSSDECGGGGDQQQGAGDHQADLWTEVRAELVESLDLGLEPGVGSDRLVDRADPPDCQGTESAILLVMHLKTEEPTNTIQAKLDATTTTATGQDELLWTQTGSNAGWVAGRQAQM